MSLVKLLKKNGENDGLVSVISSQHPFNQAYTEATDTNQKAFGK